MRAVALLSLLLVLAAPAAAQVTVAPPPGLEVSVRAGFGPGIARPGRPCPVVVSLRLAPNAAPVVGRLGLEVLHAEPGPRCVHDVEVVELQPGSSRRVALAFRADATRGVRVVLRDSTGWTRFSQDVVYGAGPGGLLLLENDVPLYGVLRPPGSRAVAGWPGELASLVRDGIALGSVDTRQAAAVVLGPEQLEERGLGALSALLIPEAPGLEPAQAEAVRRWVLSGGKLLVAAGAGGGVAWPGDSLAPLLPLEVRGQELREGALAELDPDAPAHPVAVLLGTPRPGGSVLADAGEDAPLLTSWLYGKGAVAALGITQDAPVGSGALAEALRGALHLPAETLRDLTASDALEEETCGAVAEEVDDAISSGWIVLVFFGFLLLVGPLDYLLWRKAPGPRVSWASLLVASGVCSALAFTLGRSAEEPLVVRAVALLDPARAGAPGEPAGLAVDALVCLGSRRFDEYALAAPEGLSWWPAIPPIEETVRLKPEAPDPRRVAAWDVRREALRIALGLDAVAPFRLRGAVAAAPPVVLEEGPEGSALRNDSTRTLWVTLARPGRPLRWRRLARGDTLPLDPESWSGGLGGPADAITFALAAACFVDLAPGERHGHGEGIDLSAVRDAGGTVLLLAGLPLPFELVDRNGRRVAVEGEALLRVVLAPAGEEDE